MRESRLTMNSRSVDTLPATRSTASCTCATPAATPAGKRAAFNTKTGELVHKDFENAAPIENNYLRKRAKLEAAIRVAFEKVHGRAPTLCRRRRGGSLRDGAGCRCHQLSFNCLRSRPSGRGSRRAPP